MRALLLALLLVSACATKPSGVQDTGLDDLRLDSVDPGLALPGTRVVLHGASFVDTDLGSSRLTFNGTLGDAPLHFSVPARYVSSSRLEVTVDSAFIAGVGGTLSGTLDGTFTVEVSSVVDQTVHHAGVQGTLELADSSTPSLSSVAAGSTWVNQPIEVRGSGFLLGGDEGSLGVRLTGCFTPSGQASCGPPIDVTLPATPSSEFDRTRATFPYDTGISGIGPGQFVGQLSLVNQGPDGRPLPSSMMNVSFQVQRVQLSRVATPRASLGQYVILEGNGFVGGNTDESTVVSLQGNFVDETGKQTPIDLVLIPEFQSGPRLRYVMDESDQLGQTIDLRKQTGTITGTASVAVQKGAQKLTSDPINVSLQIAPVRQVIYIEYLNSYVSSLSLFGLRAADAKIRERALALTRRIYQTLNVDFRDDAPTDFALYSVVDIAGPDPNGVGDYGRDNTPGKDVDNLRLYDRIGGVNATTQMDGYPGFGGVFTQTFLAFSAHPNGYAITGMAEPLFDPIFDPFRPDVGGTALTDRELEALDPPTLEDGVPCMENTTDRSVQAACAIWTLGNLIASTLAHEVGHSLGLADPYGPMDSYHNAGDLPNRLMEGGTGRPFAERAILGAGPADFCDSEYDYLRKILNDGSPATTYMRQPCK